MELTRIYSCLCDLTRLRILHALSSGPLCVCHFQDILREPQVKVSKHLNYLKLHGMVTARREANWMIYSLPEKQTKQLRMNLACLQDCAQEEPVFRQDTQRVSKLRNALTSDSPVCCAVKELGKKRRKAK